MTTSATDLEMLDATRWYQLLDESQRRTVRDALIFRNVEVGGYVCRKGEAVESWIGVIDGLVKMSTLSVEGKNVTFTGVPKGGWFSEGSILKNEPRKYDVVALRASRIAYLPKAVFMALLDGNIQFNRYLLVQLNERLGQFIGMVEYDRLLSVDARVARCVAAMFNPVLYPGMGPELAISQEEIGYLCGISRQRANQALRLLEGRGLVRVEYCGIRVMNLQGLRSFEA